MDLGAPAMTPEDRKMFAPLWHREATSPEAALVRVLEEYGAGATPPTLCERLVRRGLAVGTRAGVTKRVTELLLDLERRATVERIPDGRYRVARP
jgi:hypothetical protein